MNIPCSDALLPSGLHGDDTSAYSAAPFRIVNAPTSESSIVPAADSSVGAAMAEGFEEVGSRTVRADSES